jgi:hypothetical protein
LRTRARLRDSRSYGINRERIRIELIRPLIEEALGTHNQYAVEAMAGIPIRSLTRVLRDNSGGVTFAVADALVTGIAGPGKWQEAPLRGWYHSAVLGR